MPRTTQHILFQAIAISTATLCALPAASQERPAARFQADTAASADIAHGRPLLLRGDLLLLPCPREYPGVDPRHPYRQADLLAIPADGSAQAAAELPPFCHNGAELRLAGATPSGSALVLVDKASSSRFYLARRSRGRYGAPAPVAAATNGGFEAQSAALSDDLRHLVFAAARPGSLGGLDLFHVDLQAERPAPANLGKHINTAGDDHMPLFVGGDLLYISANRIMATRRAGDGWSRPADIGPAPQGVAAALGDTLLWISRDPGADSFTATPLRADIGQLAAPPPAAAPTAIELMGKIFAPPGVDPAQLGTVQVSLLDSAGMLAASIETTAGGPGFALERMPSGVAQIVFSGPQVATQSREAALRAGYPYPCYVADVALRPRHAPGSTSREVHFDRDSARLDPWTATRLAAWAAGGAGLVINQCRQNKHADELLEGRRQAVADACGAYLRPAARGCECNPRTAAPDTLPDRHAQNRVVTVERRGGAYPRYDVRPWDDGPAPDIQGGNYTAVVSDGMGSPRQSHLEALAQARVGSIWVDASGRRPKYCVGRYATLADARQAVERIAQLGMRQSYVGSYDPATDQVWAADERREQLAQAAPTLYVEERASATPLPPQAFGQGPAPRCVVDHQGVFRYLRGPFTLDDARREARQGDRGAGKREIVTVENR